MARSNGIRGSRIGAGPMGESERGTMIERVSATFWCANGHETQAHFAASADLPEVWDCHWCGAPAGTDRENPPVAAPTAPFKTHLAYVRERRTDADAEILLAEALSRLRGNR
ncbi:RNA polymerase-binding protein RbpA [Catenulispora yoronensis]|uniref:RNA polymerase-binding protein RbpA n=1 Tax=Catenulispora yoronensis TaxID=450799 RepID=A0ABN2UFZ7_9ACTN